MQQIILNQFIMILKNFDMTQEEKQLLLSLLKKANEDGLLYVYDDEEIHEVTWIYLDREVYIKVNKS